jgi:polyhydroxyalkanoate synthesis regulator phasin
MRDELRRLALFGSGVAELTKQRAERIVRDLVNVGDVGRKQASAVVKDLMEASRENRNELMRFVRTEVRGQIEGLGLATKREVERLERRVARLEADEKTSGPARKPAARRKATGASTGKTPAKRTATRRMGATKPPLPETPPTT